MKMNIKKQLKIGNKYKIYLLINLFLITFYLIDEVIIFPITERYSVPFLDRAPFNYIAIKYFYALCFVIGILRIKKEPNFSWTIINMSSIGFLAICYFSFRFFTSSLSMFLFETIAIWLLFLTNLKSFIKQYKIKRTFLCKFFVIFVPCIFFILTFLIINNPDEISKQKKEKYFLQLINEQEKNLKK